MTENPLSTVAGGRTNRRHVCSAVAVLVFLFVSLAGGFARAGEERSPLLEPLPSVVRGMAHIKTYRVFTRLGYPTVIVFHERIEDALLGEAEQFLGEVLPARSGGTTWAVVIKPIAANGKSGLVVITRSGYYRFELIETEEVPPMLVVDVPLPGDETTEDPMLSIAERLVRIARGEIPPPADAVREVVSPIKVLRRGELLEVGHVSTTTYLGWKCIGLELRNPTSTAAVRLDDGSDTPIVDELLSTPGVFGIAVDRNVIPPGGVARAWLVFAPVPPSP